MNNIRHRNIAGVTTFAFLLLLTACQTKKTGEQNVAMAETPLSESQNNSPRHEISNDFKKYWYSGTAEITSYKLEQARYGEMRTGSSVLIYVTEPFLADKQVKADGSNPDNIPVLKLNSTKNYLTGIYPYSIMSSSFYPVHDNTHALKLSFSSQEWCGQVYAQLNNREQFEIRSHSYFETEADESLTLEKAVLENELWNKIRISPEKLPLGSITAVPSLEYIRLSHKPLKSYEATTTLTTSEGISSYSITYPELKRSLKINFTEAFPHTIESWSETFISGYGANAKELTSKGTKIERIKSPYWQKNSNRFVSLRDSLGL
ncbi:septum formation inhibitor Maf [Maribacter sp. 2-571]|uniref:septum formation inhibitor Maf n=1 Tax=Maribacter sp. 2-571 TaxID=3417569 RepID=UPI003D34655C